MLQWGSKKAVANRERPTLGHVDASWDPRSEDGGMLSYGVLKAKAKRTWDCEMHFPP